MTRTAKRPSFFRSAISFAIIAISISMLQRAVLGEIKIEREPTVQEIMDLYDEGKYQESLDAALKMMKMVKESGVGHTLAADALLALEKPDEAFIHYSKAVELDPNNYAALMGLGSVYYGSGKAEQAKEIFLEAIRVNPNSGEPYNYAAHVLRDMGDLDRAVQLLEKAVKIDPGFQEAYLNLGTVYVLKNEYLKSVEILNRALEIDPLSYTAYNNLSLAYYRMGEYDKALAAIQSAIKLNPGDQKVMKNLTYLAGEIEKIKPDSLGAIKGLDMPVQVVENADADATAEPLPHEPEQAGEQSPSKEPTWTLSGAGEIPESWPIYWEEPQDSGPVVTDQQPVPELATAPVEIEQAAEPSPPADVAPQPPEMTEPAEPAEPVVIAKAPEAPPEKKAEPEPAAQKEPAQQSAPQSPAKKADVKKSDEKKAAAPPASKRKEDRFIPYRAPEISKKLSLEKVELPPIEGELTSLPLPQSGISGVDMYGFDMPSTDGIPIEELSKLRKKTPGVFYFQDGERMIWRYQPSLQSTQKMFKGSMPSCSKDGGRLLYVTWDRNSIKLYMYDIVNSLRTIIHTSDDIIKDPKFSPDGSSVAFLSVSSGFKNTLKVIALADLSVKTMKSDTVADSFSWSPDGKTIVVPEAECNLSSGDNAPRICYNEWNPSTNSVAKKTIQLSNSAGSSFSMTGRKKLEYLPDGKRIAVTPQIDGYSEFYIVDAATGGIEKRDASKPSGGKFRIKSFSLGYEGDGYLWTNLGSTWLSVGAGEKSFPIVYGHFVDTRVAWCPVPPKASSKKK